jgi:hypothetical protein
MKRTISIEFEGPPKKVMVDHHSSGQQYERFDTTSYPVQFVTAAELVATSNIHTIPEMSDEELLTMALMFEKEQEKQ